MSATAYPPSGTGLRGGADVAEATLTNIVAARTRVDTGTRFDPHVHDDDQLAWMPEGAMELSVRAATWHLRRDHFAWIPAGVRHEMAFSGAGTLISVYAHPELRPSGDHWRRPRIVGADDLSAAVLRHLTEAGSGPSPERRLRCHALLVDLLESAGTRHDIVALPGDPRARAVAARLLADPGDPRELDDWAAEVGVGAKTIARAFVADTGRTFREWRIQARMHVAAGLLAEGESVQDVAVRVGYATSSGFIAAFAARFGTTPSRYTARP
ncbi:AraC family transcriptional regulator [Herbiconiux sp. CPCC 205763]|uniref:AraC family transcriptional regulator n=1 Tax=Herbiconiux aconitum TaxID=2970913 RepID=A0ABT2GVH6_9MICO|nr:AraC family transcriptional regulator [Herbiconiux aconitum]MCS5720141.1 AraC family transcriptional regulator [Herbiconiux aconitum]